MPCQQLSHNVSYGRIVNRIQEKYMNRTLHYYQFSPETQYLDRKSARKKPQELLKHLIAFANADGGQLVIGIEDEKQDNILSPVSRMADLIP